jgi:hypothetical protein
VQLTAVIVREEMKMSLVADDRDAGGISVISHCNGMME